MKALVTGATGMLGSFLVEALLEEGHEVKALARRSSDLSPLRGLDAEVVFGDLAQPESLRAAVADTDTIFHVAARMNDWGPWEIFYRENVEGTRHLLDLALERRVERFVHVSSTGVTGLDAVLDADESAPYRAEGHYEESKVASEELVLDYLSKGLPVAVVRPCWTLGPRARRHIPMMIEYLQKGQLVVTGSGRNQLSFVDPRDAVAAMVLAAKRPQAVGQIYHVTNGSREETQLDLFRILAEELGVRPPRVHVPFALSYAVGWISEKWALAFRWEDAPMLTPVRVKFVGLARTFDISKAHRELGYEPRYSLRESLRDAVAWYHQAQEPVPYNARVMVHGA
jgi:nucleoside-diphosphate-sugar epimerase